MLLVNMEHCVNRELVATQQTVLQVQVQLLPIHLYALVGVGDGTKQFPLQGLGF